MQEEVTALRGDVAHLFLALKAAESRHQQELAGVIIDAAHHQTKVSSTPVALLCLRRFGYRSDPVHKISSWPGRLPGNVSGVTY